VYGCAVPLVWVAIYALRTYLRPRHPYELVETGNTPELQRRLDRGLDPNASVPFKVKKGEAPNFCSLVYYCVSQNRRDMLELLLAYRANPNYPAHIQQTTPLLAAVRLKRRDLLEPLLRAGADPNLADVFGNTPLMEAAAAGWEEACRVLLAAGADPEAQTLKTGVTALIAAARQGHPQIASLLLDHGANPNRASFQGGTALMDAAYNDHTGICGMLLQAGADPAAQIAAPDIAGSTALLQCAMYDRPGPAGVLLAAGADPNAHWSRNGATALHICVTNGHPQVAALLLEHGADPAALNGPGNTPLHLLFAYNWDYPEAIFRQLLQDLLQHGAATETRDEQGRTALLHCLWNMPDQPEQLRDRVRLLLKHGADARATVADPGGETPPLSPLIMAATWGDVPTAQLLLNAGADAAYYPPVEDGFARSALDMAVQENHVEMTRLLLAEGARLNPLGSSDCFALLHCVEEDKADLARLLLEAGANPSLVVPGGEADGLRFPLPGVAAARNRPDFIRLLRDFGARLDERTNWGATLLHLAAHNDALASLAWLLDQGADIEAQDDEGMRPLHEAAKTGSAAAVELLLKQGADPNSRASFGRQPLDLLGYNYDNIEPKTFKRIEQALTRAGARLSASYT
jgi:ankyrin repeat protein